MRLSEGTSSGTAASCPPLRHHTLGRGKILAMVGSTGVRAPHSSFHFCCYCLSGQHPRAWGRCHGGAQPLQRLQLRIHPNRWLREKPGTDIKRRSRHSDLAPGLWLTAPPEEQGRLQAQGGQSMAVSHRSENKQTKKV